MVLFYFIVFLSLNADADAVSDSYADAAFYWEDFVIWVVLVETIIVTHKV